MPKFLENPGVLTKDRLKSELKSQGITLPKADQRKQVYVDLYLEHLTSQNDEDVKMFSSDEEDDGESNEIRKPAPSRTKHLIRKPVKGLPYDVNALSDGDLARQLRNYGQVVGPITDTTRPLYQKKLIKILQEEMKNPETFHEQLKPPLQQAKPWEFSENEEDEEEEEEPAKPVSVSRKQKKKSQEEVVMIEELIKP
ncbi:lamina-associated polypeptide 2 isoform X7 [Exaiptasia diaphana]|uniref:Uncharacterized protein n=1 Tax=Exaiptasia diaphana TaxID=2652724 RepID=A0A913X3K3_EXADI|nr:lamina-associated polypeptide 2 isoform X7 [Exaiptasia diaphana]